MKLYHGTSEDSARSAMKQGLRPRRLTKLSNWDHSVRSNVHAVYLTDAYPLYFGVNAIDGKDLSDRVSNLKAAVIEIDTDLLDADLLVPDEDVLEALGRKQDGIGGDMNARTAHYRARLRRYVGTGAWRQSLEIMGTCAFMGTIPPSAMTRCSLIDIKRQASLCWTAMDASITPMNYRFCSGKYRELTRLCFEPADRRTQDLQRPLRAVSVNPDWTTDTACGLDL